MINRTILIGICLLAFMAGHGQITSQWRWAQRAGGTGGPGGAIDDKATSIAIDNEGNTYVAGVIYQSAFANFDTVPVPTYGESDLFIASYDCEGKLRWVKTGGSRLHEVDKSFIEIDTVRKKIYFIGTFASFTLASFTFSTDTTIIQNHRSIFVWQFEYDGTLNQMFNSEDGGSIQNSDIDVFGNIHLLIGVDSGLFAPGFTIPDPGIYHIIVDTGGSVKNVIPVTTAPPGPNSNITINCMKIDEQLNAYYAGAVRDSGFINGQKIIPTGLIDGIIIKHDPLGNVEWYKHYPSSPTNGLLSFENIAVQKEDCFYIIAGGNDVMNFGTLSFNTGHGIPGYEGVILRFENKIPVWGKLLSSPNTFGNGLTYLTIDAQKNVYVTGYFLVSATLDGITMPDIGSGPNHESFIAKFDSNNVIQYAVPLPGQGNDFMYAITTGYNGNVFVAGAFGLDIRIPGDTVLTNGGDADIFIAKYGIEECNDTTSPIGIAEIFSEKRLLLSIYPNPSNGQFTVEAKGVSSQGLLSIYDALGQVVYQMTVKENAGTIHRLIEIKAKPGIYFVRLDAGKERYYRKVVVK